MVGGGAAGKGKRELGIEAWREEKGLRMTERTIGGWPKVNRRIDRVSWVGRCDVGRRGSRKRQTRARNRSVEGGKVAQNDGGGASGR